MARAQSPEQRDTTAVRGARLFDRYRLQSRVGRGGMADVWRGHDERLDRTVAIKLLHPDLLSGERWRRRFVAEARAASGLTHPGIVPVYDVIDDPLTPAIVFQYVAGESIADRLAREGSLPVAEVARIGAEVAAALGHAHSAGVIHRDIKPANILLEAESGRARLVDFGIARVIDDARAELTGPQEVLGTLRYMAPEQLAGRPSDARTDLYALGLVLAEMVGDPATAPAWLRDLLGRLVSIDPADRPGSATDVARVLATGPAAELQAVSVNDALTTSMALGQTAADAVTAAPSERPPARTQAPVVAAIPALLPEPARFPPGHRRRARLAHPDLGWVAAIVLGVGAMLFGLGVAQNVGFIGSGRPPALTPSLAPALLAAPTPQENPGHGHGHGHGGGG